VADASALVRVAALRAVVSVARGYRTGVPSLDPTTTPVAVMVAVDARDAVPVEATDPAAVIVASAGSDAAPFAATEPAAVMVTVTGMDAPAELPETTEPAAVMVPVAARLAVRDVPT
jgi:hypothetical protein